jgi:FdhD protein
VSDGARPASWDVYQRGWSRVEAELIEEVLLTIFVNGTELASILCSPCDQDYLAVGFMKNEGLIESLQEVEALTVSRNGCCVDVWVNHRVDPPRRKVITSGCGGGVTFDDPALGIHPVVEEATVTPQQLFARLNEMHLPGSLHARARGVHAAGLTDGRRLLALAEDIGRHNTLDKLMGLCMVREIKTPGRILLATGRVSSEMLLKAARMGCPVLASRNSPTSMSVAMAEAWDITLLGYVRQSTLRAYTHRRRLVEDREPAPLKTGGVETPSKSIEQWI